MEHEERDSRIYDWSGLNGFVYAGEQVQVPGCLNIFEIAGFPGRETVSSNVLAYFFDPAQSHGLGDLFLTGLTTVLNEKRLPSVPEFQFEESNGSDVFVQRETDEGTDTRNRIDIAIHTPALSIAIENKVAAGLYNDLIDYLAKVRKTADSGNTPSCVIVLHAGALTLSDYPGIISNADGRSLCEGSDLFSISYDELFDEVLSHVGARLLDANPKAVELLEQYIDHYSPKRNEQAMEDDDAAIRQFTDQARGREETIGALLNSLGDYFAGVKSKLSKVQEQLLNSLETEPIQISRGDGTALARVAGTWIYDALEHKRIDNGVHSMSCYFAQQFTVDGLPEDATVEFFTPIDSIIQGESNKSTDMSLRLMIKAYWSKGNLQEKVENQICNPFEQTLEGITMLDDVEQLVSVLRNQCRVLLQRAYDLRGIDSVDRQ